MRRAAQLPTTMRNHSCRYAAILLAWLLTSMMAPLIAAAGNRCADGGQSRPDEGGIGGTGARPVGPEDDSGVGGTGSRPASPDDDDSGMGGTGISAVDTGVIGTITGFASICVGEVEIHYNADTPVQVDGQAARASQLAVGQVVEVVASGSGAELSAREISVYHIVSGPITRVEADRNEIEVVGQTVQLLPTTRAGANGEVAVAAALPLDSFVQVSGMRRADAVIVASRISGADAGNVSRLTGPLTRSDDGGLTIAGTPVQAPDSLSIPLGDEVRAIGQWDGSAMIVQSLRPVPPIPFDGRVARLDIEGYAQASPAGQLQVGAFSVELAPDASRPPDSGQKIRVHAVVHDRHVIAERISVIRDLHPGRQRDMQMPNGGALNHDKPGGGSPSTVDRPPDERGGPPSHDGRSAMPGPPHGGVGAPPRLDKPDMPDRPPPPAIPDRPPVPQRPDRPPRPERAFVPDRPPRPDRPDLPPRPDLPGRPDVPGRP